MWKVRWGSLVCIILERSHVLTLSLKIFVEWVQFHDNQINGTVPDEVCSLRSKNLHHQDENIEVLKADCCAGSATNEPFIKCDCCHTCCDHTTGQCQNLEKDGSLGCWWRDD
jgi:hypothetical protein